MKKQNGFSAVMLLLLMVVIGIVGFTGWFVWHSQKAANSAYDAANVASKGALTSKKSQTAQTSSTANTSAVSTSTTAASTGDTTTLKIDQWGVKVSIPVKYGISYTMKAGANVAAGTTNIAQLAAKYLDDKYPTCTNGGSTSGGTITRYAPTESIRSDNSVMVKNEADLIASHDIINVGNYYYMYETGQNFCLTKTVTSAQLDSDVNAVHSSVQYLFRQSFAVE